jgi:hypothetical protein
MEGIYFDFIPDRVRLLASGEKEQDIHNVCQIYDQRSAENFMPGKHIYAHSG